MFCEWRLFFDVYVFCDGGGRGGLVGFIVRFGFGFRGRRRRFLVL